MEIAVRRNIEAATWETEFCPKVQKLIANNLNGRRRLTVRQSDGDIFEVLENTKSYVVHLNEQTCSCGYWQLLKIPCKHACGAIACNKQSVAQYVSHFYSTDKYRAAYQYPIQPVPTYDMPDPPKASDV